MPSLQEMTAGKARLRSTPAKTPATMDRKVAKADMLRRDMAWSSDDELTPPPRYAQDYYYDSDDATPARTPAGARRPETPASRRKGGGAAPSLARPPDPPANASGAALCSAGDAALHGLDVPRSATRAFELYLRAAERGDHPPAFARVGRRWLLGEGAPRADPAEAARWFAKGVAKGDADASLATAETLEAEGAAADALRAYRSAADAGSSGAALALGRFHARGLGGLTPDPAEAARWYATAADAGVAEAQRERAKLHLAAAASSAAASNDPSAALAAELFLLAARQGDADAMNELGLMHEDGLVPNGASSVAEAKLLYARAADRGFPNARNNLGFICASEGDEAEAVRHFSDAADAGDRDAIFNLGALRERGGGGLERDVREAARLYKRAAERGHAGAPDALARAEASVAAAEEESPSGTRDAAGGTPRTTRDESAALASLRRQLAAKEKETERLAKDLGESKAECGRLKGKKAALEIETRELEKELARARDAANANAHKAANAQGPSSFGLASAPGSREKSKLPMEFGRSTSLASNRSGYSTASGVSGVSGGGSSGSLGERSSGGSPSGSKGKSSSKANTTAKPSLRSTKSEGGVPNPRSKSAFGGASSAGAGKNGSSGSGGRLSSVFGSLAFGKGAKGTESIAKEAEKEKSKAHNRELTALKRTLEETTLRAELHEEMAATLSGVLRATYARNLQLEDLLRDVGVDPDDAAIERELTPIAVETVGGFDVADLENGDLAFRGRGAAKRRDGDDAKGNAGAAEHAKALAAPGPGPGGESGEGKTRSPSPLSR